MNEEQLKTLFYFSLLEAKKSPDTSTQNGAVLIFEPDNSILEPRIFARGYNRPPHKIKIQDKHLARPQKYFYFEHAERNVIFDAVRKGISTVGSIMICPWFSCADCARAIVEAGIKTVIGLERKDNMSNEKWNESIIVGNEILDDCNVERQYINFGDYKFGIQLLRNGKLEEF